MALPYNYTQVGYIRATGTQYIDLFYQPKLFGRIKIKFKYYTSGRQILLGSWQSQYNKSYIIEKNTANNYSSDASGLTINSSGTFAIANNQWYELDFNINDGYIKIDDTTQATLTGSMTGTRAWYLFASNDSEEGSYLKSNAAVEYLQLYDLEGNLVHNFIPCLNDSGAPGLYDDIGGLFYGNEGTGTFTYAPMVNVEVTPTNSGTITGDTYYDPGTDATLTAIPNPGYNFEKWINEDYRLMDAIASTGTQYINVGINTGVNMRIVVDISPNGEGYDDNAIIGLSNNSGSGYRIEVVRKASGKYSLYSSGSGSGTYKDFPDVSSDGRITLTYTQTSNRQELTDGNQTVSSTFTTATNTGFYLFSYYGGSRYYGKFRLHNCKIYINDILVRDYVPVLKDSGLVPGLLDLVEMKFYANSGTGDFQAYEETPDIKRIVLTDNPLTIKNLRNTLDLIAQFKKSANCRYKVNGTWKNAMMFIKQNGTWKPGTPKIKINGNWKEGG